MLDVKSLEHTCRLSKRRSGEPIFGRLFAGHREFFLDAVRAVDGEIHILE